MKKLLLYLLFFILTTTITSATNEHYKFLINYHDGRSVYLDQKTFKHEFKEDQGLDYYYTWLKIEYSNKAIGEQIKIRKAKKLSVRGYSGFKYTLEHRIFRSNDSYCILEKRDYTHSGFLLENNKYPKKKWISFGFESLEGIIFPKIQIYATDLSVLNDMKNKEN